MSNKNYCNRIWGASDDLLEIDGALIEDEVNEIDRQFDIKCSDGTEAIFSYENEEWKCEIKMKGRQFIDRVPSEGEDGMHLGDAKGCSSYSDVLLVREPLAWIRVNGKYYRPIR